MLGDHNCSLRRMQAFAPCTGRFALKRPVINKATMFVVMMMMWGSDVGLTYYGQTVTTSRFSFSTCNHAARHLLLVKKKKERKGEKKALGLHLTADMFVAFAGTGFSEVFLR